MENDGYDLHDNAEYDIPLEIVHISARTALGKEEYVDENVHTQRNEREQIVVPFETKQEGQQPTVFQYHFACDYRTRVVVYEDCKQDIQKQLTEIEYQSKRFLAF